MIIIKNLTKSYRTTTGRHYVFKNLNLALPSRSNIALIGHNGAGKSTLLRMIGGIDHPDNGTITTNSSISWPVGLAGGFQGSLSGRENVKFVSRLYSQQKEVNEKVLFVEEFSELGKYYDMPLKTYSSGMRSRLGFGLSMAFSFDYYLIDEVLEVGDAQFRKKCSTLFEIKRKESNLIMVSHNLASLKEYCESAILIEKNKPPEYFDKIEDAITKYKSP